VKKYEKINIKCPRFNTNMLFTKQFIKSVSYPVSNPVTNYVSNRKISNSCSENYNIFSTTSKVVTSIILSTIYLTKLINNNDSIILDKINNIQKTLEKNNK
jgi:hypothetical protein